MTPHTKEPWIVAEESFDNDGIQESVIRGIDGRAAIAVTLDFGSNNPSMREANARRIAACVNVCEGSPIEALEEMVARRLTLGQLAHLYSTTIQQPSTDTAIPAIVFYPAGSLGEEVES